MIYKLALLGAIVDPILDAAGIPLPGLDTIVAVDCTDSVRPSLFFLYLSFYMLSTFLSSIASWIWL